MTLMKKLLTTIAALAALGCGLLSAQTVQYSVDLPSFSTVDISGPFEVSLVRGQQPRALISVLEAYKDYVTCSVSDGILSVGLDEKKVPLDVKRQYRGKGTPDPIYSAIVYVPDLLKAVKPLRRRTGLQYDESSDLRLAWIAKYIDDGVPIFWCMYSTADYNRLRGENTELRKRFTDPQEWKKQLRRQKGFRAAKYPDSAHICLIIGYNRATEEIAVSNSWGENENRPSWVPLKAAQRVGQGLQFVLHP